MKNCVKRIFNNKYIMFSICYWAFIIPLLYRIISGDHIAIGTSDAIAQIYPIMLYIRRLLGSFVDSVASGNWFVFPMVEYTLGMGEDAIAALNYYGYGDPFNILTLLVSEENLPYLYSVLLYFKVYLGGVAFIAFANELDNNKGMFAYVIGALVYSFTGFTLQSNMFLMFAHAMIYAPMIMLGAERSMKGKRKGVLCAFICLFALSGFYFLYIGSISLAVYVIYRSVRRKDNIKKFILNIGKLILEYILGLGLAAVIFVPAVVGFFLSSRTSVVGKLPLIMPLEEIIIQFENIFMPQYDNAQALAVCTIGVISIICVFLAKSKTREKINITVLLLMTVIPWIDCMMSGFGVCYDRWELIVEFYIAYLTFEIWDEL